MSDPMFPIRVPGTAALFTLFGAVPTPPVAPARRSKAPRGGVWILSRGPQALLGQSRRTSRDSTIRARAGAVAVRVV